MDDGGTVKDSGFESSSRPGSSSSSAVGLIDILYWGDTLRDG